MTEARDLLNPIYLFHQVQRIRAIVEQDII